MIVFTAPEEVLQVSRLRLQTPPLRYILKKKKRKKNGGKIEKRKEEKNNQVQRCNITQIRCFGSVELILDQRQNAYIPI